jgi:hypothetical protein
MLYVQKWTALSVDRAQYHELVDETDKGHAFRYVYRPAFIITPSEGAHIHSQRYWSVVALPARIRVINEQSCTQVTLLPRLSTSARCPAEHDALCSRCPAVCLHHYQADNAERRWAAPQVSPAGLG